MPAITVYTGADLIAVSGRPTLGRFHAVEIDNEIVHNGAESIMRLAVSLFNQLAEDCGVIDVAGGDYASTDYTSPDYLVGNGLNVDTNLQYALKWYAIYKYWELWLTMAECKCTEDDYRYKTYAWSQVCRYLKAASSCMFGKLKAIEIDKEIDCAITIPSDIFGGELLYGDDLCEYIS